MKPPHLRATVAELELGDYAEALRGVLRAEDDEGDLLSARLRLMSRLNGGHFVRFWLAGTKRWSEPQALDGATPVRRLSREEARHAWGIS